VKPPPFDYTRPRSLADALAALAEHGADARPLAGGQSLIPLLNLRLARPSLLVDLNVVPGLADVRPDDGWLVLGAMVRQRALERDPQVGRHVPLLSQAARLAGHPSIRNRGTLGGSLAHADPSAEYPAVALALDAELVARGASGERVIPAGEFFVDLFTTALKPEELLTAVRIPVLPDGTGWAIHEIARRHGDFALAGAAVVLRKAADATCQHAAIALFGVATRPLRARAAEQALVGSPLTPERIGEAAALAVDAIDEPLSDVHGSAAYRRRMAGVVVRQALEEASQRT
jgi:carbon-monoxide dehydrogenase medium subunit